MCATLTAKFSLAGALQILVEWLCLIHVWGSHLHLVFYCAAYMFVVVFFEYLRMRNFSVVSIFSLCF